MGDYRTAVASKLFKSREQFDEITRLWRTAKSYREIAGTAQSIGEVFRRVLPAPDPEPFQKIAKGFRDIAGIESELQELSRDVESLHKLRTLLDETRDARETFRRYGYVRESWFVRDQHVLLQNTHAQRDQATAHAEELQQRIVRNDEENSLLRERLAILRESDSYKLVASLEAKEQELQRCGSRIADSRGKLQNENSRLNTSQEDCEQKRRSAVQALADARGGLERTCDRLSDGPTEIVDGLRLLLSRLPLAVEEALNTDALSSVSGLVRKRLVDATSQMDERIGEKDRQRQQLEQELGQANEQLGRLERFDDLVPQLSGLDEILLGLQREGIGYKLLFQHLEWQPEVTAELQSAVEAALGQARLGTIVVSPEQTEVARKIVLNAGEGLRVLDSAAVDFLTVKSHGEPRLLDLLAIREPRVRAHLEATVGEVVLLREMPSDGTNAEWFAAGGMGGERGARWKLDITEPQWIGELHRQQIRQREQQRLQQLVSALQMQLAALENETVELQSALQVLRDSRDALDQLELPWSISQPLRDWRHSSESAEELSRRVGERTAELDGELHQQEDLSKLIAGLQSQIQGTDAATIKLQVDQLELQKTELETRLIDDRADLQATQSTITGLKEQIVTCEAESAEAQRRLDEARANLLALLPSEQLGALDHYVFETKRGSQLKEEKLADNITTARDREVELKTKLSGADGVLSDKLAIRYGFRLEDDEALLLIRDRGNQELDAILEGAAGPGAADEGVAQ